jgi:TRAP-type uncharacterized transport system substrate-binding protein
LRVKAFMRRRPYLVLGLAAAAVLGGLVWAVFVLGHPLPPRTVVMTTGTEGGIYREFGEKYRAALARHGIDLELRSSLGNIENLARLKDPSSGVSVGFVAGGLAGEKDSPGIESLGTISYDPVWVFCRELTSGAGFRELRGKRVSIDPDSGVLPELLQANGMETLITLVPMNPEAGGEALLRGEIDCASMLTVTDASIVKKLLADSSVNLMNFARADAYVALFPYLKKVTIPRGIGSLAKDLPPIDVTLIASMTSLLVSKDLHPAIQFLLLEAAQDIHSSPGILRQAGQFPAAEPVDVPLSDEARSYYASGGNFLQRHLPFWLVVLATRLLLVFVPIVGIVYPLVRMIPEAMAFAVQRRLHLLYAELRRIEAGIDNGVPVAEIEADLARFNEKVMRTYIKAPALYTLKYHASYVADRLRAAKIAVPASR